MADFDELYKQWTGEAPPSPAASSATPAPAAGSDFETLQKLWTGAPAPATETMVQSAGFPGGVIAKEVPVPTKPASLDAGTKAGLEAGPRTTTEAPSPGGAGFETGAMDLREGAQKLAEATGLYKRDYAGRVADIATRKRLQEVMDEAPVVGGAGRLAGQSIGLIPGAAAYNSLARAIPLAGEFLSGNAGGNALIRAGSLGAQGAGQGATAALLTSGQSDDPLGAQAKSGVLWGGALGAGAGLLNSGTRAAVSSNPEIANLADLAVNKYGLNSLRASQVSDNPFVRKIDQISGQMPLSGAPSADAALRGEFTRAVTRTFGEDTDRLTSAVANRARSRLGGTLENIERNNDVHLGPTLPRFADIENRFTTELPDPGEQKVLRAALDTVYAKVQPGDTITGTTFGDLIHKGSRLDNLVNSPNSNIAHFASEIKSTLRDALQSSLPADQAALYGQTRGQYHNLMAVLPLVNKSPTGQISPVALNQAVTNSFGARERALYGAGDLGELGFIGQQFVKEPKDSGTPMGVAINMLLGTPGKLTAAALGAGAGYYGAGLTPQELAAFPVSVAANRLLRMPLNSPALRNMSMGTPVSPVTENALRYVPALAGAEANSPLLQQPK